VGKYDSGIVMPAGITPRTSRWQFWKEAFWRPAVALVAIPYALYGLFVFIRDEFIEPTDVEKWKAVHYVSKLRWYWWLIATLLVAIGVALEGAYRVIQKRENTIGDLEQKIAPRIEVLTSHPERLSEFWTDVPSTDYHRVVVRNVGVQLVADAHVYLIRFGSIAQIIDLVPTGTDGMTDVALSHDVPRPFDLFVYDHSNDVFLITGRRGMPRFQFQRSIFPESFEVVFSVTGNGVPTRHYSSVVLGPQKGVIGVSAPIAIRDPNISV
jgi:hypothetical protein